MLPFVLALLTLTLALPGFASDGRLEINQTCAVNTGCFSGDAAGFPVSLTAAGSYLLTSSLVVPDENTTAIDIGAAADRSSIDLGGFRIEGVTVCSTTCAPTGSGVGIQASPSTTSVTVRNGIVRGMGSHGVQLQNRDYVKEIVAISNGGNGIDVGPRSSVIDCQAIHNGGAGIKIDETISGSFANAGESLIQGNLAVKNALVDAAALDIQGSRASGGNICGDGSCSSRGARRFYISSSAATGATALAACTAGYHMASLWEILDPSNLEYAAVPQRGVSTQVRADQGSGPPSGELGWIRTGSAEGLATAGFANCAAYSVATGGNGTLVKLKRTWPSAQTDGFGAWDVDVANCGGFWPVWCVED